MALPPGPAGLKFWQPQGITQDPFSGTLATNEGNYSLTGSDINLGPGYQLTGSDAAFVITSGSTTLTAGAGSYTLTGAAAGLAYSATLPAAAGSYALTGAAVGLGPGYQLTGFDAAFVTASAGGTTLTAAAGSYTLSAGATAALALGHVVGSSNYTLTGSSAALALRLTANSNSYTLTGSDAGLIVISGVVLFCGSGSYALNGTDATFVLPAPPPGADNYTGGASRGRMIRKFRKRKREELEDLLDAIAVTPPELPATPPAPKAPPAPGLMADAPTPARTVLRSPPDEDEDEIALLLELIS